MRIGIDISQIVYEGSGVSTYVKHMVRALVKKQTDHTFVLFGASLRKRNTFGAFVASMRTDSSRVRLVSVPLPPIVLDLLWNQLHIVPVEWFTGPLDVFWSSDWTQPPLGNAKGITTIHDLTVFEDPDSMPKSIISVQKRRLARAVRVNNRILCDSETTKRDVISRYNVPEKMTTVVYPGFSAYI